MGGYNSGRWHWHSKARTVDGFCYCAFTVADVKRSGLENEPAIRYHSSTWNRISREHIIRLDRVPKFFGGTELYLRCPRCGRRCKAVFNLSSGVACRVCHRLTYESCQTAHQNDRRRGLLAIYGAMFELEKLHKKVNREFDRLARYKTDSRAWQKCQARLERYRERFRKLQTFVDSLPAEPAHRR